MKKLIIYKGNDFWGRGINVKIQVNEVYYDLPNNSKIEIECDRSFIKLKAKYLWYYSKEICLNSSDLVFKVRVKQIFSNIQLLISFFAIAISFTIYQFYLNKYFEYLFFSVGISFLSYILFFSTIGCRNYFTFSINEEN